MTGQEVPKSWILLANRSTVDVFCNKTLLQNIREGTTATRRISCNAGVAETKLIAGDLPGSPTPACCKGIANILLACCASQRCQVQRDSTENGASFNVLKPDGTVLNFKPSLSGLQHFDTREHGTTLTITMAADKKDKHAACAHKRDVVTRRLQDVIGRPST